MPSRWPVCPPVCGSPAAEWPLSVTPWHACSDEKAISGGDLLRTMADGDGGHG
jgi:hypothetical protein